MKVSLVKEMRAVDRRAGEEYGLPEVVLMENAGRQTAAAMVSLLGSVRGKTICVLAGSGNSDSAITVLGLFVGAAFCHNFKLASSAEGPTPNGKIAVIVGLVVVAVIAFVNIQKQKKNS